MKQKVEKQFDLPTELKKIEKEFDERFGYVEWEDIDRGGFQDCSCECELNAKEIRDFIHTALLTLVKRVGEEIIGENEPEIGYGGLFNMCRNSQRSHLDEMLQTGSK